VFKVIALIFQGIKGLILDAPTGTPCFHDVDLPVLEKIDREVLVSFVQWNLVDEAIAVLDMWLLPVGVAKFYNLLAFLGAVDLFEEKFVIARFGTKDLAHVKTLQLLDVQTLTDQDVFNDNDFHMGVLDEIL
jgi:hypothetical protein